MNNKISIVVPVYNAASFVSRTIDNLLSQEVEKEIILVNDGSKDNSLSVLRNYAAKYECIRIIDQANKGVSAARNAGIDAADGEFLVFIDSDDLLQEGTLARAISLFSRDIEIVTYSYCHVNCNYDTISAIDYLPTGEYSIQKWTHDLKAFNNTHLVSCIGTKIYKTSILNQFHIRFNENLSIYEDIVFGYTYLSHVKRLYYINEPLYQYVHLGNNNLFLREHSDRETAISENLQSIRTFLFKVYGTNEHPYLAEYEMELRELSSKQSTINRIMRKLLNSIWNIIKTIHMIYNKGNDRSTSI